MTFLYKGSNEYGTGTCFFTCNACGTEYSVTPAPDEPTIDDWQFCMSAECSSYDPHRDADVLFMSNKEIAIEKKVVSIDKLRQRRVNT